jgi:hypothetical protein
MVKLAALMATWDNLEFFKCAYAQAKKHCDIVHVAVGPHSWKHKDNVSQPTKDWLDSIGQPYMEITPHENTQYDIFQCAIWHRLLDMAIQDGAEWFRFWDDDMFFFNRDMEILKNEMTKPNRICLGFKERRFIFNFKMNTHDYSGFFYKVVPDMFLTPISKVRMHNGDLMRDHAYIHPEVECFHYTMVKTFERQKARYELSKEKGTPNIDEKFKEYASIDITGHVDGGEICDMVSGCDFNYYSGEHPEAVRNHSWIKIEDSRSIK